MSYWFTGSVGWTAVTAWAALTVKAAGTLVRQLAAPAVGSERVFVATSTTGTTGAAEPTWTITKGGATTDATVTWIECTGQPGVNGSLTYCPNWTSIKNTGCAAGLVIQNNAGTFLFIVTTTGTAGNGAEPTWTLTAGATTADNTVTWTCIGAVGNFGLRAAPFARLQTAFTGTWGAAGDSFFVDDNHAETQAAAMTLNGPATPTVGGQCNIYCVDHTKANPGGGDVTTGATITTTGNNAMTIGQGGAYDGIIFNCGTGAVNAGITVNPSGVRQIFRNGAFRKLGTSGVATAIQFNGGASGSFYQELTNWTMQFGSTADAIAGTHDFHLVWRNTPSAFTGAVFPATLLDTSSTSHGLLECYGVDLSALGASKLYGTAAGSLTVVMGQCALGSGYVVGAPSAPGGRIDLINCDSGATNYNTIRSAFEGTHVPDITIVRTGGNPDITTANSWKITTTNQATWTNFFETMPFATNNLTLSTNRVVTAHGIWNSASLPNNDQIWLRVEYLGSASNPLASMATQTKANNLAAGVALSADSTSAWDSAATARANTTSYSLGNVIKLASNPGRIFFCTTAGTSAGSEPGGYASAVDGGSVTDNTAVFRAGVRFLLTVTLSAPQPALAGYIKAVARSGAASTTFWVDPYLIPLG